MGMLLIVAIVAGLVVALALFVHALRSDTGAQQHGWLVVVPLLIIAAWLLQTLLTG
jgi:hypothetical protein